MIDKEPSDSLTPTSHVNSRFLPNPSVGPRDQDSLSNQTHFAAANWTCHPSFYPVESH